jgi:hypothetical protein
MENPYLLDQTQLSAAQFSQPPLGYNPYDIPAAPKSSSTLWIVLGISAVVVIGVVIVVVVILMRKPSSSSSSDKSANGSKINTSVTPTTTYQYLKHNGTGLAISHATNNTSQATLRSATDSPKFIINQWGELEREDGPCLVSLNASSAETNQFTYSTCAKTGTPFNRYTFIGNYLYHVGAQKYVVPQEGDQSGINSPLVLISSVSGSFNNWKFE